MRSGKNTRSDHGIALISVLWALAILSLLAALVLEAGNLSYRGERAAEAQAEAEALAEAGITRAILALLDARADARWPVDGTPRNFIFEGAPVTVSIQDELGKIDLNAASVELLAALFRSAGVPPAEADALAGRVAAWRGPRSDDSDYASAGYRPRHGPF